MTDNTLTEAELDAWQVCAYQNSLRPDDKDLAVPPSVMLALIAAARNWIQFTNPTAKQQQGDDEHCPVHGNDCLNDSDLCGVVSGTMLPPAPMGEVDDDARQPGGPLSRVPKK